MSGDIAVAIAWFTCCGGAFLFGAWCQRKFGAAQEAAIAALSAQGAEPVAWQRRCTLASFHTWHEVDKAQYDQAQTDPALRKHYEYRALYLAPAEVGEDLIESVRRAIEDRLADTRQLDRATWADLTNFLNAQFRRLAARTGKPGQQEGTP